MHKLTEDHPIRCRCGSLHGRIERGASVARVACYCIDCQSYAHALRQPENVLDPEGGTTVIASLQKHVSFDDRSTLACLSLSDAGILRWYAGCCATPVANTLRNPRIGYVALVHTCLAPSLDRLDPAFGRPGMAVNTQHAKKPLPSDALRTAASLAEGVARVGISAFDGSWRRSPFFRANDHRPVVERRVLAAGERARARDAVRRSGAR